jgi:hypothetical protein
MNSASSPGRVPHFTSFQLPSILPPTIPHDPSHAFAAGLADLRFSSCFLSEVDAPFGLRLSLAGSPSCVTESSSLLFFLSLAGWLFASSCSPPRLSTTQFLSATEVQLPPVGTFTLLLVCARGRTRATLRRGRRIPSVTFFGVRTPCKKSRPRQPTEERQAAEGRAKRPTRGPPRN